VLLLNGTADLYICVKMLGFKRDDEVFIPALIRRMGCYCLLTLSFGSPESIWRAAGYRCAKFVKDLARFVGTKHSFVVNSATAAGHRELVSLGIGEGDKVLVCNS